MATRRLFGWSVPTGKGQHGRNETATVIGRREGEEREGGRGEGGRERRGREGGRERRGREGEGGREREREGN